MLQNTSRPPSVLITQVILICLGGLWLVGGPLFLLASVKDPGQATVYVLFGLLMIASSVSFLVGFWGLLKRKSYGRWIGVVGILLLLLSVFIGNASSPAGPLGYNGYSSSAQAVAVAAASIAFYGVIIFLVYRLARGKRANAFFAGEATPATA
jgi:hypothetical protein